MNNSKPILAIDKPVLAIDLNIIKNNYNNLRKICTSAKVGAAVKANCYGLGVARIAPVLQKAGCEYFFVSNLDEGIALRDVIGKNDVAIYVLHGVFYNELHMFLEYNLIPVLNHLVQAKIWHEHAVKVGKKLPCLIHIEIGMNRLGMNESEFNIVISSYINELNILYAIGHLTSSEELNNISNTDQLQRFNNILKNLPSIKKSIANSFGIFLGSNYHFDLVRPGAALYGINSIKTTMITNPVQLFAPIIQIRDLRPEESVGYNQTYTNNNKHSCRIATIPIGYADGFPRDLSNKGMLYIKGFKAPIIGRISMDLTVIDVSLVPERELFLGQLVEIISNNNTVNDIAEFIDTNAYELLTRLGNRFNRVYNEKLDDIDSSKVIP